MPKIVEQREYGGAMARIQRLGMLRFWKELEDILTGFDLRVKEQRDANGGKFARQLIDRSFETAGEWIISKSGGVDWKKCWKAADASVCIGVEIQFSGRSDLMIVDIDHLRKEIIDGTIDVGVLVAPSNRLGPFLTDRVGKFDDAVRAVERARAADLPIIVLGLEHDGPGDPLPKAGRRQGGTS